VSYLGELDPAGWEQRVAEQKASYVPPAPDAPGFFAGSLKASGEGFLRGTVKMLDFMDTVLPQGDVAPDIYTEEDASSYYEAQQIPAEQMSEFREAAREDARRKALDYWTPDPRTVGTAGRVLGGFSEMVMPLVVTRNPALLVGSTTLAEGKAQIDAGVDAKTAGINAAFAGAGTYAGFKIPIVGNTLTQRMVSGAIGNTVVNAGVTAAERATLQSRGYEELAQNYDPADVEARAVDLLTGLAFGATHHLASPQQRSAAAAANNAKHYQADTAPGIPENVTADAAHLRAMDTATEQVLKGEPVSVPEDVTQASFRERPERTPAPLPEDLVAFDAEREAASVKSEPDAAAGGYDVAEGVLTDEQLKQFQGLRSDIQGVENVRAAGEGTPGESGNPNDGGPRGEPLRVFRGSSRELSPQDFSEGALGHATGHPSSGLGVFFTNAADRAAQYGQVSEHHLDVRNPKIIPVDELPGFDSLVEAAAFRAKLMAAGHDGIVIDATHLGGPVDYVAFKPEQVLKAQKTAATSDTRLADADTRAAIEQLRGQIGLEERGGRLIRDTEGNAAGRTSHVGSPLWMHRPGAAEGKGISAKSAMAALDRVRDGKPFGAKQQEFIRYALDELDSVKNATEDFVNDAATEAAAEDPHVTAARELLAESDVKIPTGGFDAEGNPELRSARELLAAADAEVADAQTLGQGITAAVSCFLTRGE
jgi:hypothetical protein